MRDLIVRRPEQRTLTFDRHEQWQTLPEREQGQCRELVGQLLRAVLQAEASPKSDYAVRHVEASTRSDDERENSARPS